MSNVVITGMGVASTAGCNLKDYWDTLCSGKSTYGIMDDYKDNPNFRIKVGARIQNNDWESKIDCEFLKKYGRASKYAVSTALSALKDAGVEINQLPEGRTAVIIGTTMGEIQVEESISEMSVKSGIQSVSPDLLNKYRTDRIGASVREAIGISGPTYNVPTACTAGNYAIALGKRLIEWGKADVVIAGGVDVFSRVAFTGFQRLLSLTPDLCKPFDKNRKGLIVGEGCGMFVLESESSAKARGAKILGEILSVGLTSDRHHITAPHPDGDGAIRAMEEALKEAGLVPSDIDYISAHGTGTATNDKVEAKALSKVFGKDRIPVTSSIKSMLGHAMGAASALELAASIQMMENDILLPTINYSTPDPECEIDCVPNEARPCKVNCIMSNSFAFGGQVSSLIVKRS